VVFDNYVQAHCFSASGHLLTNFTALSTHWNAMHMKNRFHFFPIRTYIMCRTFVWIRQKL